MAFSPPACSIVEVASSPSTVENRVGEGRGGLPWISRLLRLSGVLEERCPDFCRLHKWLPVNWDNIEESIAVYQHKSGCVMLSASWHRYPNYIVIVRQIPQLPPVDCTALRRPSHHQPVISSVEARSLAAWERELAPELCQRVGAGSNWESLHK
jgi:hypothetical protein